MTSFPFFQRRFTPVASQNLWKFQGFSVLIFSIPREELGNKKQQANFRVFLAERCGGIPKQIRDLWHRCTVYTLYIYESYESYETINTWTYQFCQLVFKNPYFGVVFEKYQSSEHLHFGFAQTHPFGFALSSWPVRPDLSRDSFAEKCRRKCMHDVWSRLEPSEIVPIFFFSLRFSGLDMPWKLDPSRNPESNRGVFLVMFFCLQVFVIKDYHSFNNFLEHHVVLHLRSRFYKFEQAILTNPDIVWHGLKSPLPQKEVMTKCTPHPLFTKKLYFSNSNFPIFVGVPSFFSPKNNKKARYLSFPIPHHPPIQNDKIWVRHAGDRRAHLHLDGGGLWHRKRKGWPAAGGAADGPTGWISGWGGAELDGGFGVVVVFFCWLGGGVGGKIKMVMIKMKIWLNWHFED